MERGPLPNGTVLKKRFTITRLIAGGGMAWVYQVQEQRDDGSVQIWAMKEIRLDGGDPKAEAEAGQLFEQEALILARLNHPNLPKVAAYFGEGGRSYLVMEFVPGESLKKRQQVANAPILETQALDWAIQICDVLTYLHEQNPPVIFRDMKPSNVMVTPEGRIKLIDFGIARTYKQGKLKDTLAMGSENYAAPEQWGKAQSDARADVYGLGATLYHLLTNVPPVPAFVPTSSVPLRQYNPAVSEATARVVEGAMSKEREQRYPSAAALRQALVECLPEYERKQVQQAPVAPRPAPPQPAPAAKPAPVAKPALQKPCPRCQTFNLDAARFCRRCGFSFGGLRPAFVRIIQPPGVTWEMPIRGRSLLVGRQEEDAADAAGAIPYLDLSFYDPHGYVSRRHAVIMLDGEGYAISDLGSGNGSLVNGARIAPHQPRKLYHGDEVQLGHIKLRFLLR